MNRRLIAAAALAPALIAATAGCEGFTSQRTYSTLPDQVFQTRGASEARLGSWGIEDNVGIDAFERRGMLPKVPDDPFADLASQSPSGLLYERVRMAVEVQRKTTVNADAETKIKLVKITPEFKATEDLKRVFSLRVIDIDKDKLIESLNADPTTLQKLRDLELARVVTAVAMLDSDLTDDRKGSLNAGTDVEDATEKLVGGNAEFSTSSIRKATIAPGAIYAYQMSHIGWSQDRSHILELKTDRPWATDAFYVRGRELDRARE